MTFVRLRFGRRSQPPANNRRTLPTDVPDFDIPPPPPLTDWPEIQTRHRGWWQVHRIEIHPGHVRKAVLIAERRTEDEAFAVAAKQASRVRITKWGDKRRPYESFRPLLVVGETE